MNGDAVMRDWRRPSCSSQQRQHAVVLGLLVGRVGGGFGRDLAEDEPRALASGGCACARRGATGVDPVAKRGTRAPGSAAMIAHACPLMVDP
jgi:hypothetical protein